LGPIWKHFVIVGLLYSALPFVLLSWGEQYIDSALAAILIGTIPLFTALMSHLFTSGDHLTPTKTVGILVGFGGLILLLVPSLLAGVQATTWGLVAAVAAASYAGAVVYSKHHLHGLPPLVAPTAQLLTASIFLLPFSIVVERPWTLSMPSWPVAGSFLALSILCTAVVFVLYYRAMETIDVLNLSLVSYLIPIVATILGVVILGERLGGNTILGSFLILVSMVMVNGIFRASGWPRLRSAAVRS
jgi:drug/metabolite transporter (DMT)-like permease